MTPTTMEEENVEHRLLATFEKRDSFFKCLDTLLSCDLFDASPLNDDENAAFRHLTLICAEYQEQSYLLDPWLEKMITPPIEAFRAHAAKVVREKIEEPPTLRFVRIRIIIMTLFRNMSFFLELPILAIVSFFPHQVSDLHVAIDFMHYLDTKSSDRPLIELWAARYLILLWLSLICRLPFDLSQFDDVVAGAPSQIGDQTKIETAAMKIENIGKVYLDKAGLERDGAALLLARFYSRQDTHILLPGFIDAMTPVLTESSDLFKATGVLRMLSELLKTGGLDYLRSQIPQFLELAQQTSKNRSLSMNTVIRRYCTKISGRVALKLLPHVDNIRKNVKTLHGEAVNEGFAQSSIDEGDIPDELEGIIDSILTAIRDRDTTIRWSAAKYIARIAARVPKGFTDQLVDAIIDIYSLHWIEAEELPVTAEPAWHGATLGLAEFARMGLVGGDKLQGVLDWVLKALFFDVRKGAHSIGSNVRDSACYFLWSLSRTQDISSFQAYATQIAQELVVLACFDREVHIRRAAGAAFQEGFGRMGLFPHGIDVLRITDFYSVGIRRNSFLVAAPRVAKFEIYRPRLLHHLIRVTLKHWDPVMRCIGSQALKEICLLDMKVLSTDVIGKLKPGLKSGDTNELHGALLGLREIAEGFRQSALSSSERRRGEIYDLLDDVSQDVLKGYRNDLILEASCLLISSALTEEALARYSNANKSVIPRWVFVTDLALKHRNDTVQTADLNTTNPSVQQGMTRALGFAGSNKFPEGTLKSVECLLSVVKRTPGKRSHFCVEARRNAYGSLSQILDTLKPIWGQKLNSSVFQDIIRAFLEGLDDYTVDERGDVGSWVRIASVQAIGRTVQLLLTSTVPKSAWLPQDMYHAIWCGLLKQGAERLDNVRVEVGKQMRRLLDVVYGEWEPKGGNIMRNLFAIEMEVGDGWNEPNWIFPKMLQLLQVPDYRNAIIRGIVLSIGSRNESTARPAADSLIKYLEENQGVAKEVMDDLVQMLKANSSSNAVVIPVLTTLDTLIEGGIATTVVSNEDGVKTLNSILLFVGDRVEKIKNVQRINTSMRIVVQLLATPQVGEQARRYLASFLGHAFPKVREDTGEFLYMVVQTQDVPGGERAESYLLETDWTGPDFATYVTAVIKALEP